MSIRPSGFQLTVKSLDKLNWSKRFTVECGRIAVLESNFNILWFVGGVGDRFFVI